MSAPSGSDLHSIRAEADALCASSQFRAALQRHLTYVDGARLGQLSTRIHADDLMLWHSLRDRADVNTCVSQYFNVGLQQHNVVQQVVRSVFGSDTGSRTILDFACGHGRGLRFLTLASPPGRIWGCDIQREAVEFVSREFGVNGLYSTPDPAGFEPGRNFDFIWVASLFSHLPEQLFHRWLAKLASLLSADGVLCFTVHDAVLLGTESAMPAEGIFFVPSSENARLDSAIYGTTYVTETFMRQAFARARGALGSYFRIPRGLAYQQDLYVATRSDKDLTALAAFRRGPWGAVDNLAISEDGTLRIQGWAGSLDDGALGEVEIRIDGEIHLVSTDVWRGDVARVLGDNRLTASGFDFSCTQTRRAQASFLEVIARSRGDEVAMIYAGPVGGAPLEDPRVT